MTVVAAAAVAGQISSGLNGSGEFPTGTFSSFGVANTNQYACWSAKLTGLAKACRLDFTCTVGTNVHVHVYISESSY